MQSERLDIGEAFSHILEAAAKFARADSKRLIDGSGSYQYDKRRRAKVADILRRDASDANDERIGIVGPTPETTKKLRAQNTLVVMVRKGQLTQDQHNAAIYIEEAYTAIVRGVAVRLMSYEERTDKSGTVGLHESEWAIEMAERYTQWRNLARKSKYFNACMDLIVHGASLNAVKKARGVDHRTIKPRLAGLLDIYNVIARRRSKPIHTIRGSQQEATA